MDTIPGTPGQDSERQIGLSDLARMVTERKLLIGCFVVGAAVVGLAASFVMPERYDASTVFLLKERSFLAQLYGSSFIQIPFKNNLTNIRDDMLSYSNLDQVARSLGLDARVDSGKEWDDLIAGIKGNLVIDVRSQKFADDVITLAYSDSDPNRVYRVLNRVRDAYIEANVASYQEEIRKLMDLHRDRIKNLENARASTRQALTRFMQSHQTEVGGGANRNVVQLDQNERRLEELDTQILALEESEKELQEAFSKESPKVEVVTQERNPEFEALRVEGLQLQKKIRQMERVYTELHPDMIEARANLERVKGEMEGLEKFVDTQIVVKDNERYYQIRGELRDTQKKVQLRKNQRTSLETEIAVLNNNIRALPSLLDRERELKDDLTELMGQLTQSKSKLRQMEDIWERSKEAGGAVYEIVEQARKPRVPTWPNRPLILVVSMILGLAVSFAISYLIELSRQTFGTVSEAAEKLGVPVMGAIEMIVGPEEIRRQRRRRLVAVVAASFVILVGLAFTVVYFQFPEALPEPLLDLLGRL